MNEKELYEEVGQQLASRRKRLGLTQAAVAKAAGMSRASLANMEVGRQKVLVHQLYRLAAALKLDSPGKLLPIGTVEQPTMLADLTISEPDLSARQRAQIEQVYRSVAPARTQQGTPDAS